MKKVYYSILSFIITIFTVLIIFYHENIIPFGDNTYLFWDMMCENVNIFTWFGNVMKGLAEGVYTLNGGLGLDTIGIYGYYLMSPFNLIFLFFNNRNMPVAISFLILIKTGFIASSMQFYLYSKKDSFFSVILSLFYALSSYVLCYEYNIMWIDVVILLPLVIWGLDKVLKDEKSNWYILFLGISLMTNYYMAYMTCLFCVVYFLLNVIIFDSQNKIKICLKFLYGSLVAGGLSAFISVPVYIFMMRSANKHAEGIIYIIKYLSNIFIEPRKLLSCMLAGTFDETQGILGVRPLLYAGVFSVFTIILLVVSSVGARKRIFVISIVGIMIMSVITDSLYRIWHGCYAPAGCWWRYAFIWTFIIISIAYEGLFYIKIDNLFRIISSFLITVLLIGVVIYDNGFRYVYILNIMLIMIYAVIILWMNKFENKIIRYVCFAVICLISIIEILINGFKVYKYQFNDMYVSYSDYKSEIDMVEELCEKVDLKSNGYNRQYRTEVYKPYNKGLLYNFSSINMYTSAENDATWESLYKLGLGKPTFSSENKYDNNATLLTAALVGMRYIIDEDVPVGYVERGSYDNYYISENNNVFPLIFLVNNKATQINYTDFENVFSHQNQLYHSLIYSSDIDAYVKVDSVEDILDKFSDYELNKMPKTIRISDDTYTDGKSYYKENKNLINEAVSKSVNDIMNIEFKNGQIKFWVNNEADLADYATIAIPYEEGWKAYVDGKKVDIVEGMAGFLMIPIEKGSHSMVLKYHTTGLDIGIIISLISIVILILLWRTDYARQTTD